MTISAYEIVKEFKILTKIMKKLKISEMILKGLGEGRVIFSSKPLNYCRITGEFHGLTSGFLKELSDTNAGVELSLEISANISKVLKKDAISADFNDDEFVFKSSNDEFRISVKQISIEIQEYSNTQEININNELVELFLDKDIVTNSKTGTKLLEIHSKKLLVIIDEYSKMNISFNDIVDEYRLVSISAEYGEEYKNAILTQHFITV